MRLHSIVKQLEGLNRQEARQACFELFKPFGVVEEHYSTGINLVMRKPGTSKKKIILAAHYDTFPGCPGANDDFSAIAALYGIAQELWNKKTKHVITICIFDEEEKNCLGSLAFIKQHGIADVKSVIALELVGMGDVVGLWPVTKKTPLVRMFEKVLKKRKQHYETIGELPWFWADYVPFKENGIDSVCVTLVPENDVKTMRKFLSQGKFSLGIKIALGLVKIPRFFKTYHSSGDTSKHISEHSLNLAKDAVIDVIKKLEK